MSSMTNRWFLSLVLVFASFFSMNAENFVNTSGSYYFGIQSTISTVDASPVVSDSLYFGVLYPGATSYKRISTNRAWGVSRPSTVSLTYTVDTLCAGVRIGVFTNPLGVWGVNPSSSFVTDFVQSTGVVTSYPTTIYNDGRYTLTSRFVSSQLPPTLTLQYRTTTDTTWWFKETILVRDTSVYNFVNNFLISNVQFRYVYNNTNIVIAQTPIINVSFRNTFFTFKTTGGLKNIYDVATIPWEKSSNFESVRIYIYYKDSLLQVSDYMGDNIMLSFNNYGRYRVRGVATNPDFVIERNLEFLVSDPCESIKLENLTLKDSISKLNLTITKLRSTITAAEKVIRSRDSVIIGKDSAIDFLNREVSRLTVYIRDSSTINLLYRCNDVTSVQDSVYTRDIKEVRVAEGNLILPDVTNDALFLIFTLDGSLRYSSSYVVAPKTLRLDNYPSGTYYLWVVEKSKRTLYKFIKM